jgi:hypothetical protein
MFDGLRTVLAGGCVLIAGAFFVAPAGADGTPPPPVPVPAFEGPLTGICSFDVQLTVARQHEFIIHKTVGPDGTIYEQYAGNLVVEVTNLGSGKSLTYNISGPGTFWHNDATFGGQLYGPNLLWTLPENLPEEPAGVPALSYTTGPVSFTVDADSGKTLSYSHQGTTTDVCAALA